MPPERKGVIMRQLSQAGRQAVADLAQRHDFSNDAVLSMLDAVINGNGSMAQFNHPEFSGSGQWMRGGMIMVSDMFNNHLKGRIDGLCVELASLVASQPDLIRSGSLQSQSQGNQSQGTSQRDSLGESQSQGDAGPVSLFVPPPAGSSGNWWPADMGWPTSTGAQNNARYAYFPEAGRLAIDVNGTITVYDALDQRIFAATIGRRITYLFQPTRAGLRRQSAGRHGRRSKAIPAAAAGSQPNGHQLRRRYFPNYRETRRTSQKGNPQRR